MLLQVVAIIDWGDMCYCWRAAEVAIAMTYTMLLQPEAPVTAAGHVLVSTTCATAGCWYVCSVDT
jgi:Ser/Thr protein kinase RdoA (MazF antagonist)